MFNIRGITLPLVRVQQLKILFVCLFEVVTMFLSVGDGSKTSSISAGQQKFHG